MPGYLSRPGSDDRWPGDGGAAGGFGIDEAVRAQSDRLSGAGYLTLSVDPGFRGRPSACLLRMFRDLRAGRGQSFGQVDAARAWLAGQPGCGGRLGAIGFCATDGFALLMAAGHGFSVSSVNYGLVRKNAQDALHGACPIVASFGGRDGFSRTAPQRLEQALQALQALKSSRSAGRITRTSTLCAICSVRVDSCGAIAASAPWTLPAVSSVSLTVPGFSFRAFTIVPRYKVTVRAESPSTPGASESSSTSPTV
jgi:carboxymethylenebutenolidase